MFWQKYNFFEYILVYFCFVTVTWSEWVDGECSASCGEGTVKSTRTCSVPGNCDGPGEKFEACNKGACGKHYN